MRFVWILNGTVREEISNIFGGVNDLIIELIVFNSFIKQIRQKKQANINLGKRK